MERGACKVAGRQRTAEIKNKRERWEGGEGRREGRRRKMAEGVKQIGKTKEIR